MVRLKLKLKIIVDIILFLSGLISAITGIVLLLMPSGPGTRGRFEVSAGIFDLTSRSNLRLFHDWSSIILIAMVILHLLLNWRTIVCYFRFAIKVPKKKKVRTKN